MRAARLLYLLPASAALLSSLGPGSVSAKVTAESPYSRAQTYNGALRFIRVDRGFEVVEQDRETGYLLFEYRSDDDVSTGSIEVLQIKDQVKFIVQLPSLPEYHEQVLSGGLLRKLREEYGEPPQREPKPPKDDVVRRPEAPPPKKDEAPEKDR